LKRKELNSKSRQQFYNYVLGQPFQDVSNAVVRNDIYNNRRADLPNQLYDRGNYARISIGIDWGTRHWVSVMGLRNNGQVDLIRLFSVKESTSETDIESDLNAILYQIRAYRPDIVCADLGYNGNYVSKLISEMGVGRVFGVQVNPAKSNGATNPVWSETSSKVTIDKLTQNRIFIQEMKAGRIGFWEEQDETLSTYFMHWSNVVIRDAEDNDGNVSKEILRKGAD